MKDGQELVCLNCGWVAPDKFTKEFTFNHEHNKYEEHYRENLVVKSPNEAS